MLESFRSIVVAQGPFKLIVLVNRVMLMFQFFCLLFSNGVCERIKFNKYLTKIVLKVLL